MNHTDAIAGLNRTVGSKIEQITQAVGSWKTLPFPRFAPMGHTHCSVPPGPFLGFPSLTCWWWCSFSSSEHDLILAGRIHLWLISTISFQSHPLQSMLMIYMNALETRHLTALNHSWLLTSSWPSQQIILSHVSDFFHRMSPCHILVKDLSPFPQIITM